MLKWDTIVLLGGSVLFFDILIIVIITDSTPIPEKGDEN